MARVLVSFFTGLAIGFLGLYSVCVIVRMFAYEHIDPAAFKHRSPEEYAAIVENRTATGMMQLSLYGGLLCGALCAMKAAGGSKNQSGQDRPQRQRRMTCEKPLSSAEFQRVLPSCLFVDLRQRSPAYLQGLLVGRLADANPELAAKIDKFGEEHMAALLQDVVLAAHAP